MVTRVSTAALVTEVWRRYDEAEQQRIKPTPTETWITRVRQQLDRDRALLETSRRILEESRDLERRIQETLDSLGR